MKPQFDVETPIDVSAPPCTSCVHWRPVARTYTEDGEIYAGVTLCHNAENFAHDFACHAEAKAEKTQRRGRPPRAPEIAPQAPKRRGRPPKAQAQGEAPKKRGRPRKLTAEQAACSHGPSACMFPAKCTCDCDACGEAKGAA